MAKEEIERIARRQGMSAAGVFIIRRETKDAGNDARLLISNWHRGAR